MNIKNLIIRSLSGLVYVALIVLGVITTQWAFVALCSLLALLASHEFLKMTKPGGEKINHWIDVAFAVIAVLLMSIATIGIFAGMYIVVVLLLLPGYVLARGVMQLYEKREQPINSLAYSMFAQIYITLPLILMPLIYEEISSIFLLLIFVMIWANDTGAYLVGCSMGRRRLFERISPKKSWEGFWGGMVFTVVVSVLFYSVFEDAVPDDLRTLPFFIILGIVVSLFATFGDLVESMIKRSLGVKDSGNLIPGHGGILDRIDSMLFVIPAVVLYFMLYSNAGKLIEYLGL